MYNGVLSLIPREEESSERGYSLKTTQRSGGLLTVTGNLDIKGKFTIAHLCNPLGYRAKATQQ